MKNYYYKITVFVLLSIMVGAFTHCVQNSPVGGVTKSSSRSPSGSGTTQTPEQVLNTAQVEVGMKNFEQINYTFAELTGVPVSNGSVNAAYIAVESTLPTDTEVKVLQASNQVAITRLAAEYCNQLIGNGTTSNPPTAIQTNRDAIFGAGSFTGAPLTGQNLISYVNRTTNGFWGESVVPQVELDAARAELMKLYADIVSMDAAPTANATNIKAGKAVCTAALSSAYVTIM